MPSPSLVPPSDRNPNNSCRPRHPPSAPSMRGVTERRGGRRPWEAAAGSAAAQDRFQVERARLVIVDEQPASVAAMEPERRAQLTRELVRDAGELEAGHRLRIDERRIAGDRNLPGHLVPPAHADQDLVYRVPILRDALPVVDRVRRFLCLVDDARIVRVPQRLHELAVDRVERLRPLLVDADYGLLRSSARHGHPTRPSIDSSRTTLFGRLNSGITYLPISSSEFMSFRCPMPSMRRTTSS